MTQDYFYPKAGGEYRWHIQQKCTLAVGRPPNAIMDTSDNKTMLRFDSPLSAEEELLVADIFSDPATASNAPALPAGTSYMIKDIYDSDFREVLGAELGCDIILWFPKSSPELLKPDRIAITFSKTLSVQEKKTAATAFQSLILGWV